MIRVKEFNATGVAPNGRLYAGDLLAIMDAAAGLSDFTQTVDVSALRVGDSAIQLLKYGTLDARITSAFRADGIMRGLGGLYAGAFTTAQRNAIAAGSRPFGLVIFNTDISRLEINVGSDAVPSWTGIGAQSATGDYKISAQTVDHADPTGGMWLLCDGTAISGTYTALIAMVGANTPDARGRDLVMKGTHVDVDAIGDSDGLAVGSRRPKHKHSLKMSNGGAGGGTYPSNNSQDGSTPTITSSVGPQTGAEPTDSPAYIVPGNLFIHT